MGMFWRGDCARTMVNAKVIIALPFLARKGTCLLLNTKAIGLQHQVCIGKIFTCMKKELYFHILK